MKNKLINEVFAATAFGVVFANASLVANAEELSNEHEVASEKESSDQAENLQVQEDASLPESGEGSQGGQDASIEEEMQASDQSGAGGTEEVQSSDQSDNEEMGEVQSSDQSVTEEMGEVQPSDQSGNVGAEEDNAQSPDFSGDSGQDGELSGSENNTEGSESQEKGPASFEEAKENLDKAIKDEAQAKSELDEAQTGVDEAQSDVDAARQEEQEAEAELNEAQAKKEEAESQKKEADEEANRAGQELSEAEEKLENLLQDADKEEYENVQQELETKKEQQETVQQAVEEAKEDCADKESEAREAAAAVETAQKAVENAQKEKDAADQAVNNAQNEANSAQKAYEDILNEVHVDPAAVEAAKQNLDQTKTRLDEAVKKVESGSLGFFQYLQNEDSGSASAAAAVTILTAKNESKVPGLRDYNSWAAGSWEEFISYTHLGDENDATSLENMKKTIAFIRECNELRKKDNNFTGNGDLQVNDALMAIAQLNANWAIMMETPGQLEYNGHSRVFNVGENLAWYPTDGDPFKGWYFEEKNLYDSGNRNLSEVGHYLNITNWEYTATGYAINFSQTSTQMWQNCAQEFSIGTTNMGYGISYSVNEYEERFMAYYNSVMKELSDAQAAYDKAKAAYDQAVGGAGNQALINSKKAELDKAMAGLEAAQENAQEKMEVLKSAQEILAVSREREEAAQSVYEQSKGNLEAAQKELEEKTEAYNALLEVIKSKFGMDVAEAAENLISSKAKYEQALAVQDKAAEEFSSAETVLASAVDKKASVDQKLKEKSDVLVQKLQALQDAKNTYSEALANLAIARADYDRLKPQETFSESNVHVVAEREASYVEEETAQENFVNVTIGNLNAVNSRKATFLKGCSFKYFLDYSSSFIRECPSDNLIIDCSELPWFSFNKKTMETLRNSRGKSLTIIFRYKGRKYTFTIPSDYDLNLLLDSDGWYGFMYLKMIFGGRELMEYRK